MILAAYLEPDHAALGASRWAGLELIGGPPQRVEAVADSERGRKPPRERHVHWEVPVAGLAHLVGVDHDARAPPGRGVRAEAAERAGTAADATAGGAAAVARGWEREIEGGADWVAEREAGRGRGGEHCRPADGWAGGGAEEAKAKVETFGFKTEGDKVHGPSQTPRPRVGSTRAGLEG